jgi:hypothetical protein
MHLVMDEVRSALAFSSFFPACCRPFDKFRSHGKTTHWSHAQFPTGGLH